MFFNIKEVIKEMKPKELEWRVNLKITDKVNQSLKQAGFNDEYHPHALLGKIFIFYSPKKSNNLIISGTITGMDLIENNKGRLRLYVSVPKINNYPLKFLEYKKDTEQWIAVLDTDNAKQSYLTGELKFYVVPH